MFTLSNGLGIFGLFPSYMSPGEFISSVYLLPGENSDKLPTSEPCESAGVTDSSCCWVVAMGSFCEHCIGSTISHSSGPAACNPNTGLVGPI